VSISPGNTLISIPHLVVRVYIHALLSRLISFFLEAPCAGIYRPTAAAVQTDLAAGSRRRQYLVSAVRSPEPPPPRAMGTGHTEGNKPNKSALAMALIQGEPKNKARSRSVGFTWEGVFSRGAEELFFKATCICQIATKWGR
jgi:hypothetical protein